MSVSDYPKKTSMGLTLEASRALKAAARLLGVDQNRVVCLLAEAFITEETMPRLRALAAPYAKRPAKTTIPTQDIKAALALLSPQQRSDLLREILGKEN